LAIGLAVALAAGCKKDKKSGSTDNSPAPVNPGNPGGGKNGQGRETASAPPAGWCEARDAVGGYRVFMPGERPVTPDFSKAGGKEGQGTGCYAGIPNRAIPAEVHTFSILPAVGFKLGTAPDELFAALKVFNRVIDSHHNVLEKAPTTLGGKPALKVVLQKKPFDRPKSPIDEDPAFAKMRADEAAREKAEQAKRQVYYLTNTNTRLIIIQVDTPADPEPAVLNTITDSFKFL
jgi:hypothetical protein